MLVSYSSKKIIIAPARNRRINRSLIPSLVQEEKLNNYHKIIMQRKIASLTAAFKTTDAFGAKYAADFPATSTGGQQFALIHAAVPRPPLLGPRRFPARNPRTRASCPRLPDAFISTTICTVSPTPPIPSC